MVKQIIVDGSTNLYKVAVDRFNDARKFIAILQENFLYSPFLNTPQLLNLPESPPDNGGRPEQPAGPGQGLSTEPPQYPWTITTTIASKGINTIQYPKGNVVSYSTGIGSPAHR